ncbi:hypothetical protein EGY16_31220 [Burkholderia pseudomallei]|uniref:Uncharacterized protein n=3 Tax=Burkholderia pseudomallei TaxID=28450 RepID=A0AAX0UDB2_BURPE|nr:hypothetical protein BURPS1106A_A0797 [Burkholderia pseudomallei 1106a]AFR18773.1 hypothetical protein BPC006_II0842 [Burkholderia pseudomallei BPC006]ARK56523.1 hypothetical protein BOC36_26120 [Burkholderia pseudomallei]EES20953.1 hypothetical protein BURPS1106B_1190 [Burkholderia pseudomallei 1106b]EET05779.1 hypothetical protein BURPS1710A_A3298 [Burkholderia pseudomallei 1710a]EIF74119.1 hypothetical protein BP354E_3137 [Burkholderia pseudomallei 354e]EIF78839.1 hypothetical protein B
MNDARSGRAPVHPAVSNAGAPSRRARARRDVSAAIGSNHRATTPKPRERPCPAGHRDPGPVIEVPHAE